MGTVYMYQFPKSRLEGAYHLHGLPYSDAPQNPPEYCWARRHVIKFIEAASYYVFRRFGPSPCPPVIYDSSTPYGGTPSGRHPNGAHNATGSVSGNVDIGYYMREWLGTVAVGRVVNAQLAAPPTNLDTERQAVWFGAMGEMDYTFGGAPLVRMCAVDPRIEPLVDSALMLYQGQHPHAVMEGRRICFSDSNPQNGWAQFHYDHCHIRFEGLDNDDEIADYIEARWIAPMLVEVVKPQLVKATGDKPEVGCGDHTGDEEAEPAEGEAAPAEGEAVPESEGEVVAVAKG